jgi:hypothetical protein
MRDLELRASVRDEFEQKVPEETREMVRTLA